MPEQLVGPARGDDAGVRDDKGPPGAEAGRGKSRLGKRADPEHDFGRHELDHAWIRRARVEGAPTVGPGASARRATGGGAPTVGPGASASRATGGGAPT